MTQLLDQQDEPFGCEGCGPQVNTPDDAAITDIFSYHAPSGPQVAQCHEVVRGILKTSALSLMRLVPDCPERQVAIDKLREAMMWANAGIAVHQ